MFITKKELRKIIILTCICFGLGIIIIPIAGVFSALGENGGIFIVLGAIEILMGVFYWFGGRYSKGKGKLIIEGQKLVMKELRPAQFIALYEEKSRSPENAVSKPDLDVLRIVACAYDMLRNREKLAETMDMMLEIAPEKKKNGVKLLKAAMLFDDGKTDEAERIFKEATGGKLGVMDTATADAVMKCERAMARGDYSTAENYNKNLIENAVMKSYPLFILIARFNLAKIYLATGRVDKARGHLEYCAANGGETAIKTEAAQMLAELDG